MSVAPPPGWYENPERAGQLRYWDGHAWTDHLANPSPPNAPYAAINRLPDVSVWLRETFGQLNSHRELVMIVTLGVFGLSFLVLSAADWAVSDVVWRDGEWDGLSWSRVIPVVALAILSYLGVMGLSLTVVHHLQIGRIRDDVSVGGSFRAALTVLPRAVGWLFVMFAASAAAFVLLVPVAVIIGPLVVLLFLALLPVMFFVLVRVAFVMNGLVSRPASMNFLRASAKVSSDGRFWPVAGRLSLLWVILMVIGWVGGFVSAMLGGNSAGDTDAFIVEDAAGEVVLIDVGGLWDAGFFGQGLPMIVNLVVQVASMLIIASGVTALYVSVHHDDA